MKKQIIFVTGTDTEVGKTYVSCRLLEQWRANGLRVAALKPLASGAVPVNGVLGNEDAAQLRAAAGAWQSLAELNPYCFAPPIAPHLAAKEAGIDLTVAALCAATAQTLQRTDLDRILVEGAGGWLVPLNETESLADFAVAATDGVILVVAMRLGCINHALLTVAAIAQSGLPLLGWVANEPEEMSRSDENFACLSARIDAPCLGRLRRGESELIAPDLLN